MASNKFLRFGGTNAQDNMLDDAAYAAHIDRPKGAQPGVAKRTLHNKQFFQASVMAEGVAQVAVDAGTNMSDSMTATQIAAALRNAFGAFAFDTLLPTRGATIGGVLSANGPVNYFNLTAGMPYGGLRLTAPSGEVSIGFYNGDASNVANNKWVLGLGAGGLTDAFGLYNSRTAKTTMRVNIDDSTEFEGPVSAAAFTTQGGVTSGTSSSRQFVGTGVDLYVPLIRAETSGDAFGLLDSASYSTAKYGWVFGQRTSDGAFQLTKISNGVRATAMTVIRNGAPDVTFGGNIRADGHTLAVSSTGDDGRVTFFQDDVGSWNAGRDATSRNFVITSDGGGSLKTAKALELFESSKTLQLFGPVIAPKMLVNSQQGTSYGGLRVAAPAGGEASIGFFDADASQDANNVWAIGKGVGGIGANFGVWNNTTSSTPFVIKASDNAVSFTGAVTAPSVKATANGKTVDLANCTQTSTRSGLVSGQQSYVYNPDGTVAMCVYMKTTGSDPITVTFEREFTSVFDCQVTVANLGATTPHGSPACVMSLTNQHVTIDCQQQQSFEGFIRVTGV